MFLDRRRFGKLSLSGLIKILISFILLLALLTPSVIHAFESRLLVEPIYIDNEPVKTRYIMREGHLMVPALFLKHTGVFVDWNEQYRSVVFKGNGKMFALPVGKKFSDELKPGTGTWTRVTLPVETLDFGGEPFVPLIDVAKKLGMGVHYDPKIKRTFITTNIAIAPNTIKSVDTSEKLVALTFDDGPEDYYTPKILDILKEKGVPATFFVVGRQITYFPDVMKRIVNEGHAIANHTWHHPDLRYQWSSKVRAEVLSTQQEMQRVVGRNPHIFRPPYGAITKADIQVLNEIGMKNILWSVDTLDWSGMTADAILEIVHRDISRGAIILQHNFQSEARILDGTIDALPRIIDELQEAGYKFVTMQTLLDKRNEELQRKQQQPAEEKPKEGSIEEEITPEPPSETLPKQDPLFEEEPAS